MNTIAEAKAYLEERKYDAKAPLCPCCERQYKVYRRRLNSSQAIALIHFVDYFIREGDGDYVLVRNIRNLRGGDYAKLAKWGLIVGKGKKSGLWKPTRKGIDFAFGRIRIPKSRLFFPDGETKADLEADFVTISDVLKARFEILDILKGVNPDSVGE